jgi:predicted PurR-regulated permease PerM
MTVEPVNAGEQGDESRADTWGVIYAAAVVAGGGLLLWSVRGILSPLLAYFLFVALLSAYARRRGHGTILVTATTLIVIWLFVTLGGLLAPFILALALAYILDPAVDALERRVPRAAAIAILGVPALAVIAVVVILAVPAIVNQVESLVEQTPEAVRRMSTWLDSLPTRIGGLSIPFLDPDELSRIIEERQSRIMEGGVTALLGVGRGVSAVFTVLGYIVLTPVLLVYLLRDFDTIKASATSLIPPARRPGFVAFGREYDRLLSRFLRGQVIAATIVGLLTWIGLLIAGFPNAGLVGAIAGVFNVVPYLGLIASIIPVIIIALLSGNVATSLLQAGIVFAIVQFIDGSVTGPRIVGESVGLHPVWVILALAVGGYFLGFTGVLLAMPGAVLVKLLLKTGVERYRSSRLYGPEAAPHS